jgi:hypothetical protein
MMVFFTKTTCHELKLHVLKWNSCQNPKSVCGILKSTSNSAIGKTCGIKNITHPKVAFGSTVMVFFTKATCHELKLHVSKWAPCCDLQNVCGILKSTPNSLDGAIFLWAYYFFYIFKTFS